jgi:serine/threonine protein kinase
MNTPGFSTDLDNSRGISESNNPDTVECHNEDKDKRYYFKINEIVAENYKVLEFLGRGGVGEVYRVRHLVLEKDFALKIISPSRISENDWRRFQKEAVTIARMNHPNIIGVFDMGLHQNTIPYFSMELLKGCTLLEYLKRYGVFRWQEAISIFVEICSAVAYMHGKGIVHRDIKPSNIMLLESAEAGTPRVKLLDFGTAKLTKENVHIEQQHTTTGKILGSPLYLSPEQCSTGSVDSRSDLYSLGCTLFEVLTGQPPFLGDTAITTLFLHQTAPAPPLEEVSGEFFPQELENLVAKLLAKAPQDRYQSAYALAIDLRKIADGKPLNNYSRYRSLQGNDESQSSTSTDSIKSKSIAGRVGDLFIAISLVTAICTTATFAEYIYCLLNTAPASSMATKPYSMIRKEEQGWMRVFVFPEKSNLGTIEDIKNAKRERAEGQVKFPASSKLTLNLDEDISRNPAELRRFRHGEIDAIRLFSEDTSSGLLSEICRLKGLHSLDLSANLRISADYQKLDSLTELNKLKLSYSSLDGLQVSKLAILTHLKVLYFNGGTNCAPLLRMLAKYGKMEELYLQDAELSREDIATIAKIGSLRTLMLDNSKLSVEDLKTLSPLKNLETLHINNCGLKTRIDMLSKQFPKLKFVYNHNRKIKVNPTI